MIVVHVLGGLGNQLFQYAAARALALRRGTTVGIDTRYFRKARPRELELANYELPTAPIDRRSLPPRKRHRMRRALWIALRSKPVVFREESLRFDSRVLSLPADTYLEGYFQSERYFEDAASAIRADLTLQRPLQPANVEWRARIRKGLAVSLHIRRGDYVSNPETNRVFGALDLNYYLAAADAMHERLREPLRFFVFSDEPEWAKANLKLPYPTEFVDSDGPAVEHLALMSECRHHITANSSFSWWGAWLNPAADKHVIAPKQWFLSPTLDASTLVPDRWQRL
ncbi:MAG: alpha-1,2-fucosyltransferase [Bauldia sp.]